MLGWVTALFNSTVYVAVSRRELVVRDARSGTTIRWPAAIALDAAGKSITAVGAGTKLQPNGQVRWPFDHPRIVIADFQLAEKLIQAAFRELFPKAFLRPSPVVVIQSLDEWDAGLTQIERRALLELCYGAGAREAFLWHGTAPSDLSLQSGEFKRSSQLLKT